jgi:hypothetical protein
MHRFRFNLLTLFGFVAAVAVACAALARPSQLWLVVVSATSLASLFYAVLAATYGRNARRAFWVGFAVFGWGYIALEWASTAGLPFRLPISLVTGQLESVMHSQPASSNPTTTIYNLPVGYVDLTMGFAPSANTTPSEPQLINDSSDPMLPDTVIEPMPNEATSGNEPSTTPPPTGGVPILSGPIGDEPAAVPQPDDSPAATSPEVVPAEPFDALTAASPAYGAPTNDYAVKAALSWLTSTVATSPATVVDLEAFRQIARWLWSPLLGFVGGIVALRLYHRREREGQLSKP